MSRDRRPIPATTKRAVVRAPSNLVLQIQQKLRERILGWHYPPGHHLGEQELCDELDASRIPVREALRALTEQGLVDQIPNRGCFVKQLDAQNTHALYDMRLALELFVAERLARSSLPADLLARERAYWEPRLHIKATDPVEAMDFVTADERFHLSLARVIENSYIVEALEDINERLRFVRLAVQTTPHRVQTTAGEHLMVLEAIERKDAEAARRTLRRNISHSRNNVEIAISRALTAAQQQRVKRK
jgi:DNA-binding GntR family transcriptional regulator